MGIVSRFSWTGGREALEAENPRALSVRGAAFANPPVVVYDLFGMKRMPAAVVLFSGGIDSTTALYWALSRYAKVHALTVNYGQRSQAEVRLARRFVRGLGIPHAILKADLRQIGGSALTDPSIPLPGIKRQAKRPAAGLPATYVPFRNGILLALAAAWAEVNRVSDIVCGFHVLDSPGYPDTREPFVKAMEKAVNAGTGAALGGTRTRILAPFIRLGKSEIIRRGLRLEADYAFAVSCYAGGEIPCGRCSSCLLRKKAWREAGAEDPLIVRLRKEGRL